MPMARSGLEEVPDELFVGVRRCGVDTTGA